MESIYLYAAAGFAFGIFLTAVIFYFQLARLKKINKSLQGYLESEKLKKETLAKENTGLYGLKKAAAEEYETQLQQLMAINKRLDEDILLLQKNNEETEALLSAGQPVIHSLKLQLIEANNTIARYKALFEKIKSQDAKKNAAV